jgi:1-deoxy-D-xylulose 5-phosphate reductoisomerase
MAWSAIADTIREVLEDHDGTTPNTVDVVIDADRRARELARRVIEKRAGR